jgi:alpha-mannosidase
VQQLQSQGLQQQELGKSSFENDHYKLVIDETGRIFLNDGEICLRLYAEHGDTYSDERAEQLATMRAALPLRMEAVGVGSRIMFECHAAHGAVQLTANVTITTDVEPVLRWQIDLDTRGTNFSVELVYETGIAGQVFAGMPFDVVARVSADTDLLPRQLDPDLANVLLGQRELNAVRTFPFQEYIAISDGDRSAAVLAQGVNSYRATDDGTLAMTLRRSVEWLTKANLDDRVGDAGPFFYVPDARCERTVRHEIAFTVGDFDVQGMELQRRNAAFQNPPLIVEVSGGAGSRTEWAWQQRDVPLSSLRVHNGAAVARWFNPTTQTADGILPKKIITVADTTRTPVGQTGNAHCRILNAPSWRVGDNRGLPAAAVIEALERLAVHSREQIESAETQLQTATDDERYRWQHKLYVHQREMLEYQLSARLNRLKLAQNGVVSADYLYQPDAQVADIGYQLNQLRIKRRIYDYVVAALAESAE